MSKPFRLLNIKNNYVKKPFTVDKITGEIRSKTLNECIDRDDVVEYIRERDSFLNAPVDVDYKTLSELFLDSISKNDTTLLKHLCENVVGWNIYCGDISNIEDKTEVRVRRSIESLVKCGAVKVISRGELSKSHIALHIHPILVWKGGDSYKESALKEWFKVGK